MPAIKIEGREYDFDLDDAEVIVYEDLEKITDKTFSEWAEDLSRGSMTALRALVYVVRKYGGPEPDLKWSDTAGFKPAVFMTENRDALDELADPVQEPEDDLGPTKAPSAAPAEDGPQTHSPDIEPAG